MPEPWLDRFPPPWSVEVQAGLAIRDRLALPEIEYGGSTWTRPAGLSVYLEEDVELRDEQLPACIVWLESMEDRSPVGGAQQMPPRRSMAGHREVTVVCMALAGPFEADDGTVYRVPRSVAVDPLRRWVAAALMSDVRLGGLAMNIVPGGISFDSATLESTCAVGADTFHVHLAQLAHDPTRRA